MFSLLFIHFYVIYLLFIVGFIFICSIAYKRNSLTVTIWLFNVFFFSYLSRFYLFVVPFFLDFGLNSLNTLLIGFVRLFLCCYPLLSFVYPTFNAIQTGILCFLVSIFFYFSFFRFLSTDYIETNFCQSKIISQCLEHTKHYHNSFFFNLFFEFYLLRYECCCCCYSIDVLIRAHAHHKCHTQLY